MQRAAVICGLGAWVPTGTAANSDWMFSRSGIRQRHIIEPGAATSDLAVEAGTRALKSAGESNVDGVVLATSSPDHPVPATAPAVATRLGLGPVLAFDVNAACTGFVYGLAVATSLITSGLAERILLIGAETPSTAVNPQDRIIAPLFGDGAGAVVLRAGTTQETGAVTQFDLGSDGQGVHLIRQVGGGSRQRSTHEPVQDADQYLNVDGREIFAAAVTSMTASCRRVLKSSGHSIGEVDRLIAHQANARILGMVAHQLDLKPHQSVGNIDEVGNTSAASIPLALAHGVRTGTLSAGHLTLLTAFGGGLTWGSTILRWPDLTID